MPLSECVYCVAVAFTMTEQVQQWICIQFGAKLAHSAEKLFGYSEGFRGWWNECSRNKNVVQMLQRWSRICWKMVVNLLIYILEGLQQAEHLRMSNVYRTAIDKDQRLTVWELEADLGIPKTAVSEILMQDSAAASFVPQLLLPEQKEHRTVVANDLNKTSTNKPGLAPCNFWLFPKLKSPLKGKRFQTADEIQENTTGRLMVTGRTVWGP